MTKKKTTHAQELKAMVSAMNPSETRLKHIHTPKKRKKRAKETKPRELKEKILERTILSIVNSHPHMRGYKVGDEPGTHTTNTRYFLYGRYDIQIINLLLGKWVEVEIKRPGKIMNLSKKQKEFEAMCNVCNRENMVVESVKEIIPLITGDRWK